MSINKFQKMSIFILLLLLFVAFIVGILLFSRRCVSVVHDNNYFPFAFSLPIKTGIQWATGDAFPTLAAIGYQYIVCQIHTDWTDWNGILEGWLNQAKQLKIQLVIGAYPDPWTLKTDGTDHWNLSPDGGLFLTTVSNHPESVMAIYGLNEPYLYGYTPAQLRSLRYLIQIINPTLKIYHDIGALGSWINTDQTNICDFAGIWYYPFFKTGYDANGLVAQVRSLSSYVITKMQPAVPVWLGQTFQDTKTGGINIMPTPSQLQDANCKIRANLPTGSLITWYAWSDTFYSDDLQSHPELLPFTLSRSCPT